MRAFYGTRFSPNMTKTPEGFLICHSVPIARTGWQEYMPHEIGSTGDQLIKVYRSDEEVFSQATIASFEGKPVTDKHPTQEVRPDNIAAFGKGHCQNVHRGTGDLADTLLADLVITDPILIAEIESGKREVSCGYECEYIDTHGRIEQQAIRGNHVAVVSQGRAGERIAIQDTKPKGGSTMPKLDNNTLLGKILKAFSRDAEPEELVAAHQMLGQQEKPVAKDEELHNEAIEEKFNAEILAAIKALQAEVAELKVAKPAPEAKDALTELEEEMTNGKPDVTDEDPEKSVTVSPEEMKKEESATAMDRAAVLVAIKAMKPVIASLPEGERRKASDALTKELRAAMQQPAQDKAKDAYTDLLQRKKTADTKTVDLSDFGKACAKRNPHIKEAK